MNRILSAIALTIFTCTIGYGQTTATDFNVNDCSGNPHHLFSELDAGKIVVIDWVMPCASCAAQSLATYNAVQSFAASHPGRVVFYLVDDYANTSCGTLTSWGTSNGLASVDAAFSNTAISMADYGVAGMPKVVVLAGTSHTIFYNQNSGITTANVQAAINQALMSTSLEETENLSVSISLFPNPASEVINVDYVLEKKADVQFQVFNILGEVVTDITINDQQKGKNKIRIPLEELCEGTYFIKMKVDEEYTVEKFIIKK